MGAMPHPSTRPRSTPRPFTQVDVFTATPYAGNPLAVVLDGTGLSDADMQRFARWTNLAETTFLLPPGPDAAAQGADYQVRIFTTTYEMPFAGHPTLGSCHAWLEHGGVPRNAQYIVQQSPVGLVRIRPATTESGPRLAFAAPPLQRSNLSPEHHALLCKAWGLEPTQVHATQLLCNGPRHVGLLLGGDDAVDTALALQPRLDALQHALQVIGATGAGVVARHVPQTANTTSALIKRSSREARAFATGATRSPEPLQTAADNAGPDAALEVRFFATGVQLAEDPVTGSFNASVAQWLMAEGHMPTRYVAHQGCCVGSAGEVHVERDAKGQVWVGGDVCTCVRGTVQL